MDVRGERQYRILVVDNDPTTHQVFRRTLGIERTFDCARCSGNGIEADQPSIAEVLGCRVECVREGSEAIGLVTASIEHDDPFDLAFVDMQSPPNSDWLRTLKCLWNTDPELQCVLCTQDSNRCWFELVKQLGLRTNLLILKKPFAPIELAQLVASFTQKKWIVTETSQKMSLLTRAVMKRTDELHEAHHEAESLLSAIASLLIGVDAQGVIHRWNDTAGAIFGIGSREAVGVAFDALPIAWTDRDQVRRFLELSPGENGRRIEVSFVDSTSVLHLLAITAYRVTGHDNNGGLLLLGKEITEQHATEAQLAQARKLEAIGQLAAGVAHEINTPMQYIGDNLCYLKSTFERLMPFAAASMQLIGRDDVSPLPATTLDDLKARAGQVNWHSLGEQIRGALSDAEDGVKHVSRIVGALKEFSHPGGAETAPVDLNRALESTISVARHEWKYVATLDTDFDPNLGVIWGLAGDLNQVFLNLLINAAQAVAGQFQRSGELGRITVATRRCGDYTRVTVTDTGGGIPASIRQRVFDPFFTTKGVGQGTGQGLSHAHSVVVAKHQGRIWFDVNDGVGTTFFVELPTKSPVDCALQDDACEALVTC